MASNPKLNRYIGIVLPFLLLGGLVGLQYMYDIRRRERPEIPPTIIPAQAIKLGDLGLHSAVSSLMWVYAVQQISTDFEKVIELIKATNELDPKFSYPYAFSALVLPPLGFVDEGIKIAERGITEADPDWRIPYYLATTYHIFRQDRERAAFYFDMAARMQGAPKKIISISARYGTEQTYLEQTKQIWISIFETTDDELIKDRAAAYILHIEIMEMLEKAISMYRYTYGRYPATLDELVKVKILKEIPVSPLGVRYSVDPETGKILILSEQF